MRSPRYGHQAGEEQRRRPGGGPAGALAGLGQAWGAWAFGRAAAGLCLDPGLEGIGAGHGSGCYVPIAVFRLPSSGAAFVAFAFRRPVPACSLRMTAAVFSLRGRGAAQPRSAAKRKLEIKPIERLVPVSFMRCRTSTPGLSTWWSSTALKGYLVLRGASRLDAFSGYPVRT